jgi:hypothetical protein
MQGLPDHREVEFDDQIAVLCQLDELPRVVHMPRRMLPAGQSLVGDGRAGVQVDHWLVPRNDFPGSDRPRQFGGRDVALPALFLQPADQVELVLDNPGELREPSLQIVVNPAVAGVDHANGPDDERFPARQRNAEIGADFAGGDGRKLGEHRVAAGVLHAERPTRADHRIAERLRSRDCGGVTDAEQADAVLGVLVQDVDPNHRESQRLCDQGEG